MYITKDQFKAIIRQHSDTIIVEDDVQGAFEFVRDVLEAEAEAMKEKISYATTSISRLQTSAYVLLGTMDEISDDRFGETN